MADLVRINLDEVSVPAGVVLLKGKEYVVSHITSASWDGTKKLRDDEQRREKGETVTQDVDTVFRIARSLVEMPEEVKANLSIEQAAAIIAVATSQAEKVEAQFPKARVGA